MLHGIWRNHLPSHFTHLLRSIIICFINIPTMISFLSQDSSCVITVMPHFHWRLFFIIFFLCFYFDILLLFLLVICLWSLLDFLSIIFITLTSHHIRLTPLFLYRRLLSNLLLILGALWAAHFYFYIFIKLNYVDI